jgi:DnaJ-class molecular chaperone
MIEAKPTPGAIRSRNRASKLKARSVPLKCKTCDGVGEIATPGQHSVRCTECLGAGIHQPSDNRQLDTLVLGSTSW